MQHLGNFTSLLKRASYHNDFLLSLLEYITVQVFFNGHLTLTPNYKVQIYFAYNLQIRNLQSAILLLFTYKKIFDLLLFLKTFLISISHESFDDKIFIFGS